MSGLLKVSDYRYIEPAPLENTSTSAKIMVSSVLPSFVTALIFVNGEIVDFKTSSDSITNSELEITVPVKYVGKPYSVFVFSSNNGYANRDIGKSVWGVWFKEFKEESFVRFGDNERPKGAAIVVVPMSGAGFDIRFTRFGDSSAGHGEVTRG